jgi:hypothetical protein
MDDSEEVKEWVDSSMEDRERETEQGDQGDVMERTKICHVSFN